MTMPRRDFMKHSAAVGTAGALGCLGADAFAGLDEGHQPGPLRTDPVVTETAAKGNPIGVSTYSFSRTRWGRRNIEECINMAAEMGFDGVEILHNQMPDESDATLMNLKRQAHSLGLALMGFSTHQGFLSPDRAVRQRNIDRTISQLQVAAKLGIPTMRVNTGRWGTTRSFDALMANQGIEPTLDGYTEDDGFRWVIDAFEKIMPKAREYGVVMGLENHWGLGRTAKGVLRIVEAISPPWVQITLDTGNFLENPYEQMEMMASSQAPVTLVQAKTYFGGGRWYTLDIDYARVVSILRRNDYKGWISLEFEGNEDAMTGVPKSLELLRKHFGS